MECRYLCNSVAVSTRRSRNLIVTAPIYRLYELKCHLDGLWPVLSSSVSGCLVLASPEEVLHPNPLCCVLFDLGVGLQDLDQDPVGVVLEALLLLLPDGVQLAASCALAALRCCISRWGCPWGRIVPPWTFRPVEYIIHGLPTQACQQVLQLFLRGPVVVLGPLAKLEDEALPLVWFAVECGQFGQGQALVPRSVDIGVAVIWQRVLTTLL